MPQRILDFPYGMSLGVPRDAAPTSLAYTLEDNQGHTYGGPPLALLALPQDGLETTLACNSVQPGTVFLSLIDCTHSSCAHAN